MRAWLVVCAALALAPAPSRATASHAARPDPARLERIKSQILAKLGLSTRPTPQGAPPRDVVRQILARATDPRPPPSHHADDTEHAMREIIAIAHRDKCSIGCKGSPTTQAFLNGHKYNYGVEGTVSIYVTGSSQQETNVKLLGQVTVSAVGNCVHELAVQSLAISGPDNKKYQSPPGINKPVRFTLQDGRIGAEICAEEGETRRSLNIKRAIISLLQTEQKSSTQVDIFGTCPTEVTSSQEGGAVLVHRSRDLSRCGYREQGRNDMVHAVFNPDAQIKDTQVLASSLRVETKVNNGVPEKVASTEDYMYRPFSVGEHGAKARVITKLTMTGKTKGANNPSHCTESRTVIFENPHGERVSQNNFQAAYNAVKETAKTLANEAGSKSAGNFAQLVRILRTTTKDDLMKVYSHAKGNNVEKRVFLDGLFRAGTGYSIEASVQLMKNKELGPIEQTLVYLSLGNAKHVNSEALKAAASLLDTAILPREVYLGVGALAGIYCREHSCHKQKNDGIVAISQKFAAKLQNCKPKTKVDEDNVIAVLKGIRNIRHLEDNLIDKLVQCAKDNNVKSRVKVAALEAFQADPCAAKLKKNAVDIMKNRQLDSEIRIKAYLAIIECPCGQSANEIKSLLESEPVHQVGNFISSSLRQIRASSNPDKQMARQHYGLIRTPNKFNSDARKYSFYEEESFNIDAVGLGGNIEKTVIYSQDSFLPRSIAFNITTELFGRSVNVLEVGGRQGNLDRVAEHFFGPKSFLRTEDPQTIYDEYIRKPFEDSKNRVENLSRGRRSIKGDIDSFDKNLRADSAPYNNEIDLDLNLKLFGTDAVFLSLGDDKGTSFRRVFDQLMQGINKGMNELKQFQQEIRAHGLFLDVELSYPTATGLPLKLDLVGSATARLDVSTNVDIRQCLSNPQDAKVDIKLVLSTDVEVAGALLVDADAISAGLKVIVNLHSSTGGHLIAKVTDGGQGFDLQFGLPVDKQEVITASNDLVFFQAEKGQMEKQKPVQSENVVKESTGCFDQAADYIGLTICGEVAVPFSFSGPNAQSSISKFLASYPLSGPAKVKVTLEKQNLRGYHVKGRLRNERQGQLLGFLLSFEAEGTKNGRLSTSGEFVINKEELSAKFELDSTAKTVFAQAGLYNKPNELTALVKGKMDNTEYYAKAGFQVQGNAARKVYKPIAEYKVPEKELQTIAIEGEVIEENTGEARRYTIQGLKINVPSASNKPMAIDGHYTYRSPKDWDMDIQAKDFASLKGSLKNNDVAMEFTNQLNPLINFRLTGHFESTSRNEFDMYYGGDCHNPRHRIVFSQVLKYHNDKPHTNVISKNKIEIFEFPIKFRVDLDVDPKKANVELDAVYFTRKANFNFDGRTHIKKEGDYSVRVKAAVDQEQVEVFFKRDIVSEDKSNLENYIDFKNVGRYELSGVLLHKVKPNDMNVGAIGHLKMTAGNKNEDIKFDIGVIETSNQYSSHAKVSSSQGDILDYLLKASRGANPNGQLKLIIKDAIAANGNFKVTDNDGKGNGLLIVDFKTAQRKIKVDAKFVAKIPNFNADVDVFFNFEKDNADKLHISTNTKNNEKLFDSKNKMVYKDKKFEVNMHREGEFAPVGKLRASLEVTVPGDRCVTFKIDREMASNNGVYNGHADVVITDTAGRGAAPSTISYKGKIVNTNMEKQTFDYEGQVELKLKDGKQLQNTFVVKNVPEGDKFKYDFKSDLTGNMLDKPLTLSATGTYVDSITDYDEKYRLKGSYGDDLSIALDGTSEVKIIEKGDKKFLDENTLVVRLPFEKAHDIKIVSNLLYLQPQDQDTVEFSLVESVQINADVYKVETTGKASPRDGQSTLKLLVPHVDPFVLDVNYRLNRNGDTMNGNVDLKAKYGKGKTASITLSETSAPRDKTFVIKANAPQAEQLKKLELTVHSKNPAPDTYSSTITIDADGRVYKTDSNFVFSKANPVVDVKYTSPSTQKTSRVYVEGTSLSSTQGKIEIKVDNVRDICFDIVSEGSIQKDNVNFKLLANSENFGWKNYKVDIASKDSGNGKRLEFHATNDNKNVLSGSTSFISKQEGPKTIIEGSGAVKVKEEQKSANFKYIRTILGEGTERGVETFFNMAIGDRSYVAESRITNLEFKNSYVYCEEKKQCAHAELNSKIDTSKPGVILNVVNANFDLRKLGVSPEFGLMIKDEVSDKRLPQYTLDLHVNKDDRKYHLHVYDTPEYGNAKSGITVQLPQRTLALESVVSYPTDKGLPFPVRGEIYLDLDKNKPGHKTSARFLVDVDVANENQQRAVAEIGFSHPKLNKEAVIRFRNTMQRSGKDTIRIETSSSISHPILGNDRESKLLLEVSPTRAKFEVVTPLVKVIDVEASATVNEKLQKAEMKFCLLEGKPVQVTALAKDYTYFEFTTDESDRKLSVVSHIKPEERVDVSADILLSGQKRNIAHGALFLQDNLIKSDYGASKENYEYFVNALKKDMANLGGRITQLSEKANNDFKQVMQRVEPTIKDIQNSFNDELNRFYKEIGDDKTLREISQALSDVVQYFAKMIEAVFSAAKPFVDSITQTYAETIKKIQEIYEKQIEPQLKKLYEVFAAAVKEFSEAIIDTVAHFMALTLDFYEKHKPELEELTNVLTNIFKDLTRLLVAQLKEFRLRVAETYKDILQRIQDLPILGQIKEKWAELAIPDQATAMLQEAYQFIRPLLPTEEVKEFADALNSYVQKKLRQEACDDNKELRVIYQKLSIAITSLVQMIRSQAGTYGVANQNFGYSSLQSFFGPGAMPSAPEVGGSTSVSFLSDLLTGDVPDILALIKAYRPRSVNPLDEVPSQLRAVIVNGQHIFTFDGRHLTFPGSCRYVLAHDFVDRNFTLLMQLNNGAPKALILEDKSGAIIELKDNGQVTLNGANHGYPVIEKDVFAFRQANGRLGIGSKYGLMALCTSKLEVCYFEVNGFYLGKLRGLLGDGNNEPYDDFRLPNGKICESEGEFGNAYRLARSCPQVSAPEHSHHQMHGPLPPACEQVFGGMSPLKPLNLFLDIAPFRQACVHACSGDSSEALQQACDLARGYTALAVTGLLPAVLPEVCVTCRDADKPRKLGETYELKLPAKQADIIVTFETVKVNEKAYKELLVPLVSQLVDNLKGKRITDIKVYLVGITSKYPYPIVYDTDLKLKNPKPLFDDESRYQRTPKVKTGVELVDKYTDVASTIYDVLAIKLGSTNVLASYTSIFELPLRAGAVKHGFALVGESCEQMFFPVQALHEVIYDVMFENMAYTVSIVGGTPQLSIGNGKNPAEIVGYTEDSVLMLGDKKFGKDTESLRSTLEKEVDGCKDVLEAAGGLVFSSTNYFKLDNGQQKQFLQTAAGAISQKMLHETIIRDCTCGYADPFRVRSICVTKDRKEAARSGRRK